MLMKYGAAQIVYVHISTAGSPGARGQTGARGQLGPITLHNLPTCSELLCAHGCDETGFGGRCICDPGYGLLPNDTCQGNYM